MRQKFVEVTPFLSCRKSARRIEQLHEYNDLKDATQALIGKLAEIEGKLVKDVYADLGLSTTD